MPWMSSCITPSLAPCPLISGPWRGLRLAPTAGHLAGSSCCLPGAGEQESRGKTSLSLPFHLTNAFLPPSILCPRREVKVCSSLRQLNPGSCDKPSIYLSCWVHQRLQLQPLAWLINRLAGSSRCRLQTETSSFSLCPNHQAQKPPQLSKLYYLKKVIKLPYFFPSTYSWLS